MNKYIVKFSYDGGLDYWAGQLFHMGIFSKHKILQYEWHHGQGNDHYWVVSCSTEELSMLCLEGARVFKNLTNEYKISGLAKLTAEEKEALGLVDL